MPDSCEHLDEASKRTAGAKPSGHGCKECLATGGVWVHLRLCLSCGHVGCCDSSRHRHATAHHEQTWHPVIQSFQPGEDWRWCFVDKAIV